MTGLDARGNKLFNEFMKPILCVALLIQLISCSHAEQDFEQKISAQQCDEALKIQPQEEPLVKTGNQVKYLANNIAAYTYITANYTTEVLWDATAGTVTMVAICGPLIGAGIRAAQDSHTNGILFCPLEVVGSAYKVIRSPPLGRNATKQTEEMRCPDLKGMSRVIGRVVGCYENKGDTESLKKAIASLENVEKSKDFFTCLPNNEQMAIAARRADLQKQVGISPEAKPAPAI